LRDALAWYAPGRLRCGFVSTTTGSSIKGHPRTEVSALRQMLAGPAVDGQLGAVGASRLILVALLLWLAVPAAVSLVAGWFLLRPSQTPPSGS
jgi:hypothetical protein